MRPKGWRNEPARHALAAKGIKTRVGSPIPSDFTDRTKQKSTSFNDLRKTTVEMSLVGSGWPEGLKINEETQMKLQLAADYVSSKFNSDAMALYITFGAVHGGVSSEYVYNWARKSYDRGRLDQDIQAIAEEAYPDLKDLSKTIILHDLEAIPERAINLPKGWTWQGYVMNAEEWDKYRYKISDPPSKTLRIIYWEGLPEDWLNIPAGYKTLTWFDHM